MELKFKFSSKLKIFSLVLTVVGLGLLVFGIIMNPQRGWANFLLNNYYFISLSIGALFFMALQYLTHSGWSAMFRRIPEAIGGYIPFAALFMIIFAVFGSHYVYHWSHSEAVEADVLLQHKSAYLNIPFFIVRAIIIAGLWFLMVFLFRKNSLKEDTIGGLEMYKKNEFLSKVFLFILAVTFSFGTFDMVMSIDSHWFSTIFAIKNLISAFFHGTAVITLIVILLHKQGYLPKLNKYHLHDFSKYLFMLSIVWGYMWFSQYILIWYANIPEETVYYTTRINGGWSGLFYADLVINWLFPFLFLMLNKIAKNKVALIITIVVVLVGMWVDLYLQIMPGATGINAFNYTEIGSFIGFAGIFIFTVAFHLSKAPIIPKNHPYLEESVLHEVH